MPSEAFPEAFSEGAVDPQATVDELIHWALSTSLHLAAGLVLGALATTAMRSRHLHWTWAAIALALLVLARPDLGGATLTLSVAALFATIRSRRWHHEDIDAGADLADIAARRRRPLDLLRSLAWAAALRVRGRLGASRWQRRGALAIGVDDSRRIVSIPFGGNGGTHTLVVGATGSGKTVTQTSIAVHAIRNGLGAVVIDPKGDRGMREQLHRMARLAGRPFIEWTPNGNSVYNPYARGGASEIADKALAGERFTEPHYLRQAQRYLGHVVRVLHAAGDAVSLRAIVQHLDPERLELLLGGCQRPARVTPSPTWTRSPSVSGASSRACATGWRSSPSQTSARGWIRRRVGTGTSTC